MKKKLSFLLCAVIVCNTLSFTAFAAEKTDTTNNPEDVVLELEYMDFYMNQDYYMSLVEDKNYTLHFDVPKEYEAQEMERQRQNSAKIQALVPSVGSDALSPRGTTVPTTAHNITQGSYSFKGDADYSNLYTEKYCIGSAWYIVTVNNNNYTNYQLRVTAYNVLSSQETTYFSPGTTVKKYTMTGTGATANTKHFYLKFHAPVKVSGTIARGTI